MGADRSYWGGITAKTNGTVDLEYCYIENAEVGLFLYSTASTTIRYNTFKNNRIGLCAYANSPVIRDNYFTDNAKAVAAHAGSTPYLASPFSTTIHYNNGIINNDSAISIYSSTPYVVGGYNDIYNDTLGVYMAFYSEPPSRGLRVGNNYYGSTVSSEVLTHFVPSNKFEVVPLLDSAQTSFKNQGAGGAADLLAMAFEQYNEQKYTSAVQIFNQLIDTYPEETEALWSVTGSYQCHREGGLSWLSFIDEMESLVQDTTLNAQLQKYAMDYMLLALRHNFNYNAAIAGYEAILNNQPSWYDSIYAIINISNTLLESGGFKSLSAIDGMDQELSESEISHIIRTKELLFSNPKEKQNSIPENECLQIINIFPNPTTGFFTIEYSTCEEGTTRIDMFAPSGKNVLSRSVHDKAGQNIFYFDQSGVNDKKLKPGVYIVNIANSSGSVSRKIIIQ
nr:T9SS type A sorting domain-containing protein [Bacteroidota bacterium]